MIKAIYIILILLIVAITAGFVYSWQESKKGARLHVYRWSNGDKTYTVDVSPYHPLDHIEPKSFYDSIQAVKYRIKIDSLTMTK